MFTMNIVTRVHDNDNHYQKSRKLNYVKLCEMIKTLVYRISIGYNIDNKGGYKNMKDLIIKLEELTIRLVHESMDKRGERKKTIKEHHRVINEIEKHLGLEIDELYKEIMK